MNFRQIEAFRAVMMAGTLTRAALLLRVSQPAVSKLISDLERSTRLQLFERRKGRVRATEEGIAFYEEVARAFIGLDRLRFAADDIRSLGRGTLRVASLPVLGNAFVPDVIGSLMSRHAEIKTVLHVASSEEVKRLVQSGQFDVGLAADEVDMAGVDGHVFAEAEGVCLLPEDSPLRVNEVLTPRDLTDCAFLSLALEDAARARIDRLFEDVGVRRRIVVETQYAVTLCNLVRSGAGAAVVNPFALAGVDPRGLVVRRLRPAPVFRTYIMFPPTGTRSRVTAFFAEAAEASCKAWMTAFSEEAFFLLGFTSKTG